MTIADGQLNSTARGRRLALAAARWRARRGAAAAYARMLHDKLRDRGIHVGHTAIGGAIGPGLDHQPDDVADIFWRTTPRRGDFQIRLGINQ